LLDDPTALAANVLSFYDEERPVVHPQQIQKHLELIGADIRLAKITDRDFEVIFRLREGLDVLRHAYDFILIDCVPSFGYLSAASLYATDGVLIPVRLLLDSRVVDWSTAYHPTLVILSSLKPLFFNRLKDELRFLDNGGA